MAEQLPFDLGHRSALTRDDFWVSSSNAEAVGWIDRWPQWPAHMLIVHGPAGCGKSHLCHVMQARGDDRVLVIDDADKRATHEAQAQALLHAINAKIESGGDVMLTGQLPPAGWRCDLADLRSRLTAAPAVAIEAPDDTLMAVVLTKLFSDRQISVPQEVVQFVLTRAERSFDSLRRIVAAVDRKALTEKRAVTVPLVRDVLHGRLDL